MKLTCFTSVLGLLSALIASQGWAFPIQKVQSLIQGALQSGARPIGVFDIDETLLHTTMRKALSYRAAIDRNLAAFSSKYPAETRALASYTGPQLQRVIAGLKNTLDSKAILGKLGIQNELFRTDLDTVMLPIYLSDDFMRLDTAYQGAQAVLNQFYRAGGEIYFVSSRYRSKQFEATLQRLLLSKLYANPKQSHILLREDGEDSLAFKVRAYNLIKAQTQAGSKVVLTADNEPENLNALMQIFPQATPVFVLGAILNQSVNLGSHPLLIKTRTFLVSDSDL